MSDYHQTALTRYGGWIVADPTIHRGFVRNLLDEEATHVSHVMAATPHLKDTRAVADYIKTHHKQTASGLTFYTQAVTNFERAMNGDSEIQDLFDQMFIQASPDNPVSDFGSLILGLNLLIRLPPMYFTPAGSSDPGMVISIYMIFDYIKNTAAAFDLFRKPKFNVALKELLDNWHTFLSSEHSKFSLNDAAWGWFNPRSLEILEKGRGVFNETYETPDPNAIGRGYSSWNEFFTRKLQPGARPVVKPDNDDVINNACESTVYRKVDNANIHDQFWLKGQAYSLYNMLNRDAEYARIFEGGTIYQAFLSIQDYHRWHSPINGVIEKVVPVLGTYFAILPDEGAEKHDDHLEHRDPRGASSRSQGWLTMFATRVLIYIRASNPRLGLVCFIAVGMGEVSTCITNVRAGDEVKKGGLLGMFQFGGSTHVLIFQRNKVTFEPDVKDGVHIKINKVIARVKPASQ